MQLAYSSTDPYETCRMPHIKIPIPFANSPLAAATSWIFISHLSVITGITELSSRSQQFLGRAHCKSDRPYGVTSASLSWRTPPSWLTPPPGWLPTPPRDGWLGHLAFALTKHIVFRPRYISQQSGLYQSRCCRF